MSKKKGAASSRNGRDSNAQRLGENVGKGSDDTLFATADGTVQFGHRRGRKLVDVLPVSGE